jgi:hypothetical protein
LKNLESQTFQSNGVLFIGAFGVPLFSFARSTFSWLSQRVFAGRPRLPLVFAGFSSSSSTTSSNTSKFAYKIYLEKIKQTFDWLSSKLVIHFCKLPIKNKSAGVRN